MRDPENRKSTFDDVLTAVVQEREYQDVDHPEDPGLARGILLVDQFLECAKKSLVRGDEQGAKKCLLVVAALAVRTLEANGLEIITRQTRPLCLSAPQKELDDEIPF